MDIVIRGVFNGPDLLQDHTPFPLHLIRREKEAKGLSARVTYEEITLKILQKKIDALKTQLAELQKGPKAKPPLPPSKQASTPVVKKEPSGSW